MCRGSRLREEARPRKRRQLRRRRLPQAGRARQQLQTLAAVATSAPVASPVPTQGPPETRKALAADSTAPAEPEVRKAKPVTKEELSQAGAVTNSPPPESGEQNRVAIQPLKRTYVRVTLGDEEKQRSNDGSRRLMVRLNFAVSTCRFGSSILKPLRSPKTDRRCNKTTRT